VVAGVIGVLTFIGILFNEAYRPAIVAIAIAFAIGLVLFAIWGRHRLVLSPEEEYAMSGGQHRDPEVEHYGSQELESELPPEDFTR
jgi:ethanolamine permease